MDINQHLAGHRIRQYRADHGLTVAQVTDMLAEHLGRVEPITRAVLQNWESRGKVARPAVQRAFAALGICEAADWLEPAPEPDGAADQKAA